jgi:hypothetical protein
VRGRLLRGLAGSPRFVAAWRSGDLGAATPSARGLGFGGTWMPTEEALAGGAAGSRISCGVGRVPVRD